jgi:hypothetical protein
MQQSGALEEGKRLVSMPVIEATIKLNGAAAAILSS